MRSMIYYKKKRNCKIEIYADSYQNWTLFMVQKMKWFQILREFQVTAQIRDLMRIFTGLPVHT